MLNLKKKASKTSKVTTK